MEIPDSTIQSIINLVTEQLNAQYDKHIFPKRQVHFSKFFRGTLAEVLEEVRNLDEVTNETVPIAKRRYVTKKRWYDKALEPSENGFYYEVENIAKGVYDLSPDKFSLMYDGFSSYEEFREDRLQKLNDWLQNESVPVCAFPYLSTKPDGSIQTAMRNDITYIIYKEIKEKCPRGKQTAILAMPHSMSERPIDHTNRVNITDLIEQDNQQHLVNEYQIDDERFFESLYNLEELKQHAVEHIAKTLNSNDVRVFLYCMSLRDENFYHTRVITVEIGKIVRFVFDSDGKANYDKVRDSLNRLGMLTTRIKDQEGRGFLLKFFDNVDIYGGDKIARITVNVDIVNQFVKKQTINMYQEIIDRFTLDSSKFVIFPLQRERIRCHTTRKVPGEPLILDTNYNFFRGIFFFSNKRKSEHHKLIEKTLTEFVENKITLKSYERRGDKYRLEFYPISNQESRDLLDNRDVKSIIDLPYEQLPLPID